jgi:phospholipid/cholesterol/gamma-HCH transport system substrate-binding protein
MESRSHALWAGFFTIALVILTTIFALWLGKDNILRTPYTIATKLSVAGLNLQAAVRYKGIKVGNVSDIDFDEKNPGQILLKLDILADTPVTANTFATLGYQGVTGIAYVQLDEDSNVPTTSASSNKTVTQIPLRPGLMQNLEQHGMAILAQTEELSKRLNSLLDANNQKSLVSAVDNIGKAATAWQSIPGQLEPVLRTLPDLVSQTRSSVDAFKVFSDDATITSKNIRTLSNSLQGNDGAFARLNGTADQIGNSLTLETLPGINNLSREARSSVRSINRVAETLSARPQSLFFGNTAVAPGPGEAGYIEPKNAPKSATGIAPN